MSRYPLCFGKYQGELGDLTLQPIGVCRQCVPWKQCQERSKEDFIKGFRAKIEEGEDPPCYGRFPGVTWICAVCPLRENLACETEGKRREHNKQAMAATQEEDNFLGRLRKKVKQKWGGADD